MRHARPRADATRYRTGLVVSGLLRLAPCPAIGLTACTAPPPAEAPTTVAVEGCPVAAVEAGCLMLRAADGQLYDITAATPPPALDGRTIRLTGGPSDAMSFCMQGARLADITWSYAGHTCAP